MRWIGFISLAFVVLLVASVSVREYFLRQEVDAMQQQLMAQLKSDFQNARDLERVLELSESENVFERYLRPAMERIQDLTWPISRTRLASRWEREVHIQMDNLIYEATQRLSERIRSDLSELRLSHEAGLERLMKVLQISAELPESSERVELIESELTEINTKSNQEDQLILNRLRQTGKDRLKSLSEQIDQMSEAELIQYLSSEKYQTEVQKPILEEILKLNRESLRMATWSEFTDQLQQRLQRKNRQLVRSRQEEAAESEDPDLSELLKQRFDELREQEKLSDQFDLPPSPSSDFSSSSIGTN